MKSYDCYRYKLLIIIINLIVIKEICKTENVRKKLHVNIVVDGITLLTFR